MTRLSDNEAKLVANASKEIGELTKLQHQRNIDPEVAKRKIEERKDYLRRKGIQA